MKRASAKNDLNRPLNALERLEEIAQTLSSVEWASRLRHLQKDIADRQTAQNLNLDPTPVAPTEKSSMIVGVQVDPATPLPEPLSLGQRPGDRIQFRIAPKLLRTQMSAFPMTRAGGTLNDALLLAKNFSHRGVPILVQAWLAALKSTDNYNVRVVVRSMPAFLNSARVELGWGDQVFEKQLARGKAAFQIAHPDFSQDLALTLELSPQEPAHPSPRARTAARAPKRAPQKRSKKV